MYFSKKSEWRHEKDSQFQSQLCNMTIELIAIFQVSISEFKDDFDIFFRLRVLLRDLILFCLYFNTWETDFNARCGLNRNDLFEVGLRWDIVP